MNGKFILVFVLCTSLSAFFVNFSCSESDLSFCSQVNTSLISNLFNLNSNTDLTQSGGFGFSDDFSDAVASIDEPQSGVGVGDIISIILDPLKIIFGIISFFTPIPIIDLLNSLGAPLYVTLIIGVPLVLLYIITVIEFVRGAPFGSG